YYVDRPESPLGTVQGNVAPPQLHLNPPPDTGRIIVGVVDTAVQPLGNDLDSFILKRLSVAGDTAPGDNLTHGTGTVEEIMRSLQSMNKGNTSVQFVSVDVFGQNENASTFDVANGIATAINNGATWINASLGGAGNSSVLQDIVKSATDRGIPIFAAA